jgi:hypothetical protein
MFFSGGGKYNLHREIRDGSWKALIQSTRFFSSLPNRFIVNLADHHHYRHTTSRFVLKKNLMPQSIVGHVFVSYSRRDDAVMRRIVKHLRAQDIKVWVDNEKLVPGTPVWEYEIEKAIKGASAIVVILSPDAKKSEWVLREITLADQYQKRAFPVLAGGKKEDSIPFRLITRQFVDIRADESTGLNSLSSAISFYLEELSRLQEEREAAKRKIKRLEQEREMAEKAAQEAEEKADTERRAREEADRIAKRKKVEEERFAQAKLEEERLEKEKIERLTKQKAEGDAARKTDLRKANQEPDEKTVQETQGQGHAEKPKLPSKARIYESSKKSQKSLYASLFFVTICMALSCYGITQYNTTQNKNATKTAQAGATKIAQVNATKTAATKLQPTNTIVAKATNTVEVAQTDSSLSLVSNGLIETYKAGVDLRDFIVSATFQNPYSTAIGPWDYGFIFRNERVNEDYRLIIRSNEQWVLIYKTGSGNSETIQDGQLSNLDLSENGSNSIWLLSKGDTGLLYVNESFVTDLDLSARTNSGDVSVGAGFYSSSEIEGYSTEYMDFEVQEISQEFGPVNGSLAHDEENNSPEDESAQVNLKDFIVETTFMNPYSPSIGSWNYGFRFRAETNNNEYRLIIRSVEDWVLFNRTGSTDSENINDGQLPNLDLSENGSNSIWLFCKGDTGVLYVNGKFVADLDLSARTNSGDVHIGTGFYSNDEFDGYSTEYTDFSIWEIP